MIYCGSKKVTRRRNHCVSLHTKDIMIQVACVIDSKVMPECVSLNCRQMRDRLMGL